MTFNPSQYRVPAGGAGGGRWGAPRDGKAAAAQKDTGAQKHYTEITKLPKGKQQSDYVKGLSDGDLEKLTAILYSSRTSDPTIVQARITVANEMSKRGLDIKKYGALGGGPAATKKATTKAAPKIPGRTFKAPAKVAPKAAAAAPAPRAFAPGRKAI